jgi:hypothetical protein
MRARLTILGPAGLVGLFVASSAFSQNTNPASQDEAAFRKDMEAYSEAYNKGNIDAVGLHWAPDAEYIK